MMFVNTIRSYPQSRYDHFLQLTGRILCTRNNAYLSTNFNIKFPVYFPGSGSERPLPYYDVPGARIDLDLGGQNTISGEYCLMTKDSGNSTYNGRRKSDKRKPDDDCFI